MTWRILTVCLLLGLTARAQLGMSISDCDIKFNAGRRAASSAADKVDPLVSGPDSTNLTYIYKGYTLRIGFVKGAAACVDYTRAGSQKLSEKELGALLEANPGEEEWLEASLYRIRRLSPALAAIATEDGKIRLWARGETAGAVNYNLGRSMRLALKPPVALPGPRARSTGR